MTLPKSLSSGWPYWMPHFNSFEDMSIKINSIWVPVQDSSSVLYKSSLSSQEIVTCSVKYWGELPGPHSLSLSSWPTWTWHKIIESDSTLWRCLGSKVCFGTPILWGARSARTPISSPLLRKVMFQAYFGLVTMALVHRLFCCKILPSQELGILCWRTPPNLSTTLRYHTEVDKLSRLKLDWSSLEIMTFSFK